jgi:hypothetical protein
MVTKIKSKSKSLKSIRKTKKTLRKSPSESASIQMVGTIAKGNDGLHWVVDKTENGIKRWVHTKSSKLNGLELLSEEFLKKNLGKNVKLYCREYQLQWPHKKDFKQTGTHTIITFIPTGNNKNTNGGKLVEIEGHINFNGTNNKADFILSSLQMSSKDKSISTNLINTEVFVESK